MPPRRPLTDLCLISVFKILPPSSQLKGAKMSPKSAILVRAANRKVKTLVIAPSEGFDSEGIKATLNKFSLASKPIMQLLPAGGKPSFPDYPMTTRVSKWNSLVVDNIQVSADQIVNVFSAVTDLKLCDVSTENLIALLQRPQWANQLVNLAVFRRVDLSTEPRFIAALNALSALQCLALEWNNISELPNLNIFAQLKVIAVDVKNRGSADSAPFLRSLDRHTEGVDMQLYLFGCCPESELLSLSEPFCSRIVRCRSLFLNPSRDDVSLLCRRYSSLTSLRVYCSEAPQLGALFTALSQLPQLVHLGLELIFTEDEVMENQEVTEKQPQTFRRSPMAQLATVRALELNVLCFHSHSQAQWLNLPVTLPRLQVIHIHCFECESCHVSFNRYRHGMYSKDSQPSSATAFECLRANLPLLHPGVPHSRIILGWDKPYTTLEQLLSPTTTQ